MIYPSSSYLFHYTTGRLYIDVIVKKKKDFFKLRYLIFLPALASGSTLPQGDNR